MSLEDFKESARAATVTNITLSGLQTVDGVVLANADRVLVKNQTLGATNGLYQARAGAWNRVADADTSAEVTSGLTVVVTEGSQAFRTFVLITVDPITLGSTSLTFIQKEADLSYTHTQAVASTTWVITHSLGKLPSVMILDSTDTEVFADIHYTSTLQLEVLFSTPQTGKALLN